VSCESTEGDSIKLSTRLRCDRDAAAVDGPLDAAAVDDPPCPPSRDADEGKRSFQSRSQFPRMSDGDDEPAEDADAGDVNAEEPEDATGEDADAENGDAEAEAVEETDSEAEDAEAEETDVTPAATPESLNERLDAVESDLEEAETEADLDAVEAELDAVAADVEAADLPEPDEDEEDAENPREDLEARIETLREDLEEARGPYAEDVIAEIESAQSTLTETRWTAQGEDEIQDVVASFLDDAGEVLDEEFAGGEGDTEDLAADLDPVAGAVDDAGLDPDDDEESIAALLEATDALQSGLDDAQEWDDLEVREQLEAEGFYDVLGHYKDYPVEWSALKEHEQRGNVEMILLAFEKLDSDFMEEHCMEALTRMNDQRAFEKMHELAGRRDKPAIRALGKMAAEDAVDTLLEYVDADSDPQLQKVTFKALGEIGDERATQALANKLEMENDTVRPVAARALGLLGDTRAIDPLSTAAAEDDRDEVRAAAAWALRQIGTEAALEAAAEHVDDRSFIVQHEAEQARDRLDAATPTA